MIDKAAVATAEGRMKILIQLKLVLSTAAAVVIKLSTKVFFGFESAVNATRAPRLCVWTSTERATVRKSLIRSRRNGAAFLEDIKAGKKPIAV